MGDYGCKCKCAILCKTYGCIDWNPSCDSVYCDCKEQWEPITIEPNIVKEYEGLVDFDDILAVKFKRTPVCLELEDKLYDNPDLMDEVIYFLRHTHGHGKPFKDQFRVTFPELDDLLSRLKPRPLKEQKGKNNQSPEVPNEPLGNLDPPTSRWGFLSDWWNKPSAQANSKENKQRIIDMVNGVEKKEDLLSTMQMLKDSGDTPLYTDITKHFLENGLIMSDGTRILEPISNSNVLKKSLATDGILHAIEDKIKEEEEFKRGKKRKQMQPALQAEKKPKTEPVIDRNSDSTKNAVNQPEESKSSFWGVPNWFSSKSTGSNPSEFKNALPEVFLPKVNPSEYSNFDTESPKPSNMNNQYFPYDEQAESIYDDGYHSETSQENQWSNEEANSPLPTQQFDENEPAKFQSEYPLDQDIEFIDQKYLNSEFDILQNPKNTPTVSVAQSSIAQTEPDWFNFSWEQDNLPISSAEEEFLKNEIPQTSYGSLTPPLENNSHLIDTPFTNVKLDQPTPTDSSSYFFKDFTHPQETNPQNTLNGDHREILSLPDGFDLGSSVSDESSDGRNLNFFFSKQPAEESTKQFNTPSTISRPIMNKNTSTSDYEKSDENEENNMLQNLLKLANVPVNDSMTDEDEDTLSLGTRNLGLNRGFDEVQLSNPKMKSVEPSPASSPILDNTSTFDDDYIIERTHLNRLHGIIPDSSESIEYVPVTRIIRKKKKKPTEEAITKEAPKEKIANELPKESVFSFPQSTTSVQFEGLPGSPILQIDGLPSQQFKSNRLSNKGTLPETSQSTIQEPKVRPSEKSNSHISEGLKNILPAYVTDNFSASIENINEIKPEKNTTVNNRVKQQSPMTNYKPGAHVSANILTDSSILPVENLDGSNNPLSKYIKKPNPEQSLDPPHRKLNKDMNLLPEGTLLSESPNKVPQAGRNKFPSTQILLDDNILDENNLSEIINKPTKTASPKDQIKSKSSLFNIPQDFNNSEPSTDISSPSGHNVIPENETEYSKPLIPTINSLQPLDNPLSEKIPGKDVIQGNLFSPNTEEKNSLSPEKMKISDNLAEPQILKPAAKYISKPVNHNKTAKNSDKKIPVIREDRKRKTGSTPPASITFVPDKSDTNPAKNENLEQDILDVLQNDYYTPTKKILNEPNDSDLKMSPAKNKMAILKPTTQNDETANPYQQEHQNSDDLKQLELPTKEDIDFNDFILLPKKTASEKDNNSEDEVIDLSQFLGLNDKNQLEDLIENSNNKIKSDEFPENNHHENIENIFEESSQADIPILQKVNKDTESSNKNYPSRPNQNNNKVGIHSKDGDPASISDDSLFADDDNFDDFFKLLNNPTKNDSHYSESEDSNLFDQKQLEDLDDILNNEKPISTVPLSKLDNHSGLEENSLLPNNNGNPFEYKINDEIKPATVPGQAKYSNRNDGKSNPRLNNGKNQQPLIANEITLPKFSEEPDFDDFFKPTSSLSTDDARPNDNDFDLNMFFGIDGLDEFKDLMDDGVSNENGKNKVADLDDFSGMNDLSNNTELKPKKNNLIPHQGMVDQPLTISADSSNASFLPNMNNFVKLPNYIPRKENDENIDLNSFSAKDGINQVANFTNDSIDNNQHNQENRPTANEFDDYTGVEDFPNNSGAFDLPNKYKKGAKKKIPKLPDLTSQTGLNPNNDDKNKNQNLPHINDKNLLSFDNEPIAYDFNIASSDNAENDSILDEDFWNPFPGVGDVYDMNSIFDKDSNEEKQKSTLSNLPSEYDDFSGLNDLFDNKIPLENKVFLPETMKSIQEMPVIINPINSTPAKSSLNSVDDFQPDSTYSFNNNAGPTEFPFPLNKKNRTDKKGYLPHDLLSQPGVKESKLVTVPQNDLAETSTFEEPIPQAKVVNEYLPHLQTLPSDSDESSVGADVPSVTNLLPNLLSNEKIFLKENLDSLSVPSGSRKQPNGKNIPGFPVKVPVIDTSSLQSEIYTEDNDFVPPANFSNGEDNGKNSFEDKDESLSDKTISNLHDNFIPLEDILKNDLMFPPEDIIEFPNIVEGIETSSFVPTDQQFPFISPKNQRKPKNSNLFQNLHEIPKNISPLENKIPTGENILEFPQQSTVLDDDDVFASLSEIQSPSQIDAIKHNLASTSPELVDEDFFIKDIFDTQPLTDQTVTSTNPDQDQRHDNEQWNSLLQRLPSFDTDDVYPSKVGDESSDHVSNTPLSNSKQENSFENENLAADTEVNIEGNTLPSALSDTLLKSDFPIPQTFRVKSSKYPTKEKLLDNLPLPQNLHEFNQIANQLEMNPQTIQAAAFGKSSSENELSELIEKNSAGMPVNEKEVSQISQPNDFFNVEKQSNFYPEMRLVSDNTESTLPSESIILPEVFENANSRNELSQPTTNLDSGMKKSLENVNMPPNRQKPKLEKRPKTYLKNKSGDQTPMKEPSQYNPTNNANQPTVSLNKDLKNIPSSEGKKELQTPVPSKAEFKNEGSSNSVAISPNLEMKEPINITQLNKQWPIIEKSPKKSLLKKPDIINAPETFSNYPLGNKQEPNKSLVQDSNDMPNLATNEELPSDTFQSLLKHINLDQDFLPEYEEVKMKNKLEPNNGGNYKNIIAPENSQYLNNETQGKFDDENINFENPTSNPIYSGIQNSELGYLSPQEDIPKAGLPVGISLQPTKESNLKHPKKQMYNILGDTARPDGLAEDVEASLTPQTLINSNPLGKDMKYDFEDFSDIEEEIGKSIFPSPSVGKDISNSLDNIELAHGMNSDAVSPEKSRGDNGQSAKLNKGNRPKKVPMFESGDMDSAEEELLQQMMKGWSKNKETPAIIPPITIDDGEISLQTENNQLQSNDLDELEHLPTTINHMSSEKPLDKFSKIESNEKQAIKEVPFMYQETDNTNSPFLVPVADRENNINFAEEQRISDKSSMENILDLGIPNDSMVFSENNLKNSNTPQNGFPSTIFPSSTPPSEIIPYENNQTLIPQSRRKPGKFQKIMDLLNPESVNNKKQNNSEDVPQNLYEPSTTENTADITKIDNLPEIPNDIRFSIDNETGEISSIVVPAQNININKSPIFDNKNFLDDNVIGKAPIQQDLALPIEPSYPVDSTGISYNELGNESKTPEQKFSEAKDMSSELPMSLMDILKLNDMNSLPELNLDKDSNNLSADLPAVSKSATPIVNHTSDIELANEFEAPQKFTEPNSPEPTVSLIDLLKPSHSNRPLELNSVNELDTNKSASLPSNMNIPDDELSTSNQINTSEPQLAKQSDISPEFTMSLADILKLNNFDDPSRYNSNNELLIENLATDKPSNEPVVINNQQKPNQIVRPSLPKSRPSNSQQTPSVSPSSNLLKNKNDVDVNVPNIATVPKVKAPNTNLETIITKVDPVPQPASPKPPSNGPPTQVQSIRKPITPRPVQTSTQPSKIGPQTSLQNDSNKESLSKKPVSDNVQQKISELMSSFPEEAEGSLSLDPFKMDEPLNLGLGQPTKPKTIIKPTNNNTKPLRNTNGSVGNSQPPRPTQQQVQMNSKPPTLPANSKPPIKPSPPVSNNRPTPAINNLPTKTDEFDFNDPFSIFAMKETAPAINSVPSSQVEGVPKFDFDGFGDLDILVGDDKFTEQEMMLAAKNPKVRPDILLSAQNTGNTNTPKVEKPTKPSFAMRTG